MSLHPVPTLFASLAPALALLSVLACGGGTPDSGPADDSAGDSGEVDPSALARCDYVNPFSQTPECKEYTGAGWQLDTAEADCQAPVIAADPGVFVPGEACPRDTVVGECLVAGGAEDETIIVVPGEDPGACSAAELGCTFAGGEFTPGEVCLADEGEGVPSEDAFVPFEQVCMDPLDGEPEGQGPDGQVCTWQAISGATEEGRHFADYADCDVVRSQRPYWAASATADTPADDPRLSDPGYQAELAWVTDQVQASACVCCHTTQHSPDGRPSGWYLEAGPIWLDSLDDDGLAMMAGWVDSTVFGAFPAQDNNGFSRDQTGMLTTDVPRLQAFLEGELARRGFDREDFSDTAPFGGPLYDQLAYEPEACGEGQGIDADGILRWTGGPARYVYVLPEDGDNPGVPPNLDLPEGTVWRLDVPHVADPLPSGVQYGEVPDGAVQGWPLDGAPAPLQPGRTYYLVALLDIYQPATRCLFEAP